MSLIYCPECGHEISANAIACPNCGRPIHATAPAPIVDKKVIVTDPPRERGFPPWAFVPIGLLALILLMVAYMALRQNSDEANTNVNVNVAGRRPVNEPGRETRSVEVPPSSVEIPPSSGSQPITIPGQTTTVPGSTTSSAPVAPPPPTKGTVVIKARVAPRSGSDQPARNTKFYLLDKDLQSILNEARVPPVEGNSIPASLGLAAVFPDRFGEFQKAAMRAIARHVKYTGTTDSGGNAALKDVSPNEYYLFAIVRMGHGFAMWDSPVSVINGENMLDLSPASVTEVEDPGNNG